jgi:hypothetical protein
MTSGAKQRWNAVNDLQHTNDRGVVFSPEVAKKHCAAISSFFVDNISRMKDLIANRLTCRDNDPFMFDNAPTGDAFECLQPVTQDEVRKLVNRPLWTLFLLPYSSYAMEFSFPS